MNGASAIMASLWVALGSAIGGVSRYWVGVIVARLAGETFPWGTLLINAVGSFVIGYFGTLTAADGLRPAGIEARLFVMVGLCGGFTTFSSFSLQTVELLRGAENARALAYILASVGLCLAGTAFGHYVAGLGAATLGTRS
jgi:CrcB protein